MIADGLTIGDEHMIDGIIALLEQRKNAIEQALAALREAAAPTHEETPAPPSGVATSGRKGKKRTAEQKKRMAEGQRRRYAALRGESEPAAAPTTEPQKPKRQISAEGIKRIIAATKKRWRLKRAADKAGWRWPRRRRPLGKRRRRRVRRSSRRRQRRLRRSGRSW